MAGLPAQCPARGLEIVHAISGRARIRACRNNLESLETLAQYLKQLEGIRDLNLNQQTGSLLVTFDQNKLSLQKLLGFLRQYGVTQTQQLQQMAPHTELWAPVSAALEAVQLDSIIPLMVGMLMTQRLGIHGLPAIPLYLIAATTTRQVIDQLELELPTLPLSGAQESPSWGGTPAPDQGKIPSSELYRVAHAVPGRVRFQVPRLANDRAYSRRLERLMEAADGIVSARINCATTSLVVTYKTGVVSDAAMRSRIVELLDLASVTVPPNQHPQKFTSPVASNNVVARASTWHSQRPALEDTSTGDLEKVRAVVTNGPRPLSQPQPLVLAERQTATTVATLPRSMPKTDSGCAYAKSASKKPSVWDEYKPPALSIFLAFMANLY